MFFVKVLKGFLVFGMLRLFWVISLMLSGVNSVCSLVSFLVLLEVRMSFMGLGF